MGKPLVSIVTATYNRSNVLRFAIESVIGQSMQDWELIVVGDACTDDTEEVVASFKDPRIRFYNLEQNIGEQSGPNNFGGSRANGRFIAYLNHDDLWTSDHLSVTTTRIEAARTDLVFTAALCLRPDGDRILGAMPEGRYCAHVGVPASSWLMDRSLIEEIGPWKYFRDIYTQPSQDFLGRVYRAGRKIEPIPNVTLICFPSGARTNAYSERQQEEQVLYWKRMVEEPDFRERDITELAIKIASEEHDLRYGPLLRRLGKNAVLRTGARLGMGSQSLRDLLLYRRKGGMLEKLQKKRGLEPMKRGRTE